MNKRHLQLILCCIIAIVLAGCWDDISIEDRGFIVGFAIDLAEENKNGNPEITLTNQLIIPAGIGSPSDSGGGDEEAYMNISGTGDSIYAIDNQMRMSISKLPYFEHVMVIVLSKDVLEIPNFFPNIMDLFFRNNAIRRGTKIIVTDGKAKEFLEITPTNEKVPVIYLDQLLNMNSEHTGGFRVVRLGDIHELFLANESFTVPQGESSDDKVSFDMEVVFNGPEGKVVGLLNDEEIRGMNLLKGTYESGPIEFNYEGSLVTFNIEEASSKIKIDATNSENLSISVDIDTAGEIVEVFGVDKVMDPRILEENERKAAEKIEEIVNMTIEKVQQELQTDVFGLKRQLRQRHYDTWEKVKDDWDSGENHFSDSTFHVKATVNIRDIGESNKSQDHKE